MNDDNLNIVFLSRRNLLTLLNKLDRVKAGGESGCTIIKNDTQHPEYPCSTRTIISAVEDDEYYSGREAGAVLPIDEPR